MTNDPISGAPKVVFSIPLISKENAGDWSKVCANLAKTVETLRRQVDPNWSAVICCQTKPDGIEFDDRIIYLPFTEPVKGNDKTPKRNEMLEFCADNFSGDIYFFNLDADDYVHPELVRYMIQKRDPSGYLIDRGYLFDTKTGRAARLSLPTQEAIREQQKRYVFDVIVVGLKNLGRFISGDHILGLPPRLSQMRSLDSKCGSCVAWRYRCDPARKSNPRVPVFNHKLIRKANEEGLMNLHHVGFEAIVYAIGHGENLEEAAGKLPKKNRYFDDFLLPAEDTRKVLSTFGVD